MSMTNSLDSIYFIKVPEGTSFSKAAFKIDPNIELPVQKKEKDAGGGEGHSLASGNRTPAARGIYGSGVFLSGFYRHFALFSR